MQQRTGRGGRGKVLPVRTSGTWFRRLTWVAERLQPSEWLMSYFWFIEWWDFEFCFWFLAFVGFFFFLHLLEGAREYLFCSPDSQCNLPRSLSLSPSFLFHYVEFILIVHKLETLRLGQYFCGHIFKPFSPPWVCLPNNFKCAEFLC